MADQPQNQPENPSELPPGQQDPGGRPPVLDEQKRRQILAILANGSSRRVAARVAGCAHSTIRRTAERDPVFAAELDAAEHCVELEALRNIRRAAKDPRYWRAAAWILERRYRSDFARRPPNTLGEEDVLNLWLHAADPLIRALPNEEFDKFQDHLHDMVRAVYECNNLAQYLPVPPPDPPEYVTRDDPPGDCPDFRSSENGTVPFGSSASQCPVDDCAVCPNALVRLNGPSAGQAECSRLLSLGSHRFQSPGHAAAHDDEAPPHDAPSPAQSPTERASRGFAPLAENAPDQPTDQPSPQFITIETLPTTPTQEAPSQP